MKRLSFVLCTVLLSVSCGTITPLNSLDDSALIKIECRNDGILKQSIITLLKSTKARDISVNNAGDFVDITAAFMDSDTPHSKVGDIGDQILAMPGVTHVEIERNKSIVRQPF